VLILKRTLLMLGLLVGWAVAQAPSGVIPASYFGMHNMQYSDWPTFSIGALGKGTQVLWPYIEYQHGSYDWSLLDNYVSSSESHGLAGTFFFTNDTFPRFATGNTGSCYDSGVKVQTVEIYKCTAPPSDWSYFDSFWTAVVQRYGTRMMYEAFNEFNTPEDYSGTTAQLITLVQHFHDVIRATCPNCKIGSPNSNGTDQSITDQIFASGAKAQDVDFITFHSYHATPEVLATTYLQNIKTVAAKYPALAGKPFYDTEAGWGSYSVSDKAGYIARAYLMLWSKGASRFYWYAWDNSAWGTLKGNTALTTAYQQTYSWMVGATMDVPCAIASGTVWTCHLTKSGVGYLAVWNTAGTSTYTPAGGYTQYKNLAGNTITLGATVSIGTQPILLGGGAASAPAAPTGLTATVS
jgi:hypothetical protein